MSSTTSDDAPGGITGSRPLTAIDPPLRKTNDTHQTENTVTSLYAIPQQLARSREQQHHSEASQARLVRAVLQARRARRRELAAHASVRAASAAAAHASARAAILAMDSVSAR